MKLKNMDMKMNYLKLTKAIVALFSFLILMSFNMQAQKKAVKVKVIKSGDTTEIKKDTTVVNDVVIIDVDGESKMINIDSIVQAHTKDIDKHMKVMAFHMDSLSEMNFDFDFEHGEDIEKMHIEIERMLKEKGIAMEELKNFHKNSANNMIFISKDGDNTVDVETIVDEDGEHVKIITKKIHGDQLDGVEDHTTYIIKSDDKHPMRWHSKSVMPSIKVEAIPVDDIAFLKKAGVSSKKLLNDPLIVEDFKIKIEKKIENDLKQTLLHIECLLPSDGEYSLDMIKKDGVSKTTESKIPAGELKKEFELEKDEAPYYLILSKNNKLFGRKITL
jgi:hypothetical protein